ncbi:MAG TPA: hypothetical protein VGF79_06125, partial [Bacteroidia bacterium]
MSFSLEIKKNFYASIFISICAFALFIQSESVEGGLDSWEHFMLSKSAFKHPELFLNQWNKPIFTAITVLPCQLGINALVIFNLFCLIYSCYLISISMLKLGYKDVWLAQILLFFTPILFKHSISGLTEPLNILMIAVFIRLWVSGHFISASAIAGLLPFIRTEGFVVLSVIVLLVVYNKKWKCFFGLLSGILLMNLIGFLVTKDPFWVITQNPYFRFEMDGKFDPGRGSFFHFFKLSPGIIGLPLIVLFIWANYKFFYNWFKRKYIDSMMMFAIFAFWAYFMAHTMIYFLGILGSHGLDRPFAVLAPFIAVSVFIALGKLTWTYSNQFRLIVYSIIGLAVCLTAYDRTGFPAPWSLNEKAIEFEPAEKTFIKAGEWLIENQLINRPIVHQSPFFDVKFNKDPYDVKSSYRIWSIDQSNDWS